MQYPIQVLQAGLAPLPASTVNALQPLNACIAANSTTVNSTSIYSGLLVRPRLGRPGELPALPWRPSHTASGVPGRAPPP